MTIRTTGTHYAHPYHVNSTTAKTLLQYLNKKGLLLKHIQQNISYEFKDLESPEATLPLDIYLSLWDLAIAHTNDTQLGLRLALKPYNNEMSLVSHVFFNSDNLREGLKQYIRYFSLINNAMRIELVTQGDQAILQFICDNQETYCAQDMEHTLALSVMRIKEHFKPGTVIALDEVHFQHQNSSSSLYGKIFQCPVFFGQAYSALVFKKKYLDYTFPRKSTHLFNFLISHLEKLLSKIKKDENLKLQVIRLIEKSLANGSLDAEYIAGQLHMSRHTLYRRLKAEGVSYHELVDDVRKNQAIRLLRSKQHTLSEIAFLLGFSELSAFSRAFKKWTGQTPAKFKSK